MAKKSENKVTVNKFEKIWKEQFDNTVDAEWRGIPLKIQKVIPIDEAMTMVEEIAINCFVTDNEEMDEDLTMNIGKFVPEVKDFIVRCNVLSRYAGFALPANINQRYKMVYETDAFDFVLEHINKVQFNMLMEAADRRIMFDANVNRRELIKRIETLISTFELMQAQSASLLENVEKKDFEKAITVLSGGMDEEKVVKAFLDAKDDEEKPAE